MRPGDVGSVRHRVRGRLRQSPDRRRRRLELQPRGGTALYDSLGRLITDVGAELAAHAGRRAGRARSSCVVMTDGHENSSREWTHEAVSKAIKRQERDYAWDFIFLGANMDAVAIGQQLGFAADRSMTYAATAAESRQLVGVEPAYVSRRMRAAPAAGSGPRASPEDDRRAAQGDGDGGGRHRGGCATSPSSTPPYGPVRGVDDGTVKVWKGIRYAAPPAGELRWRAPQPPDAWTEVADATAGRTGLPATDRSRGSRSTSARRRATTA